MHKICHWNVTYPRFFSHNTDGMIPSSQILLDTCPTSILCNNKETIGNIRYCNSDETLIAYKNGGSKIFTQIAPFKILPMEVHFNPDSMANIIAVNNVASIT